MNGVSVTVDELVKLRVYAPTLFAPNSKKSSSPIAGAYASPFRGRGIDFSEVRLYQPGDDIRQMDWRVTARTGKPHTKLFTEERERPVFFVVDMRSHMKFATRVAFKSVLAARCASLLAWAASGHGDRVGGIVIGDKNIERIEPGNGKRGVTRLIRTFADVSAYPPDYNCVENNFAHVAQQNRKFIRPGSLIYVISDFVDFNESAERVYVDMARHCDVVFIHTFDPVETAPPPPGIYSVSNGRDTSSIDTSQTGFRQTVGNRYKQRVESLRRFCRWSGIWFLSIATNDDWKHALSAHLRPGSKSQVENKKVHDAG